MDDVYGICLINLRNEVTNNDTVNYWKKKKKNKYNFHWNPPQRLSIYVLIFTIIVYSQVLS